MKTDCYRERDRDECRCIRVLGRDEGRGIRGEIGEV
jgi:hypothetical protein